MTLRDYQLPHAKTALAGLLRWFAFLDASDTGTGKTFVALWIARELGIAPLVLCPKSVVAAWKEVSDLVGVPVEVVNYEKVRGVRRRHLVPAPICETNGLPFLGPFTVRLSSSEWGFERRAGTGTAWTWALPYELIIFDEVDRCSGSTSLTSKLLIAARRQARYLHCMSATPADDPRQFKALGYALRLFELPQFKWWLLRHGCVPGVFGGFAIEGECPDEQAQNKHAAMLKLNAEIFGAGRGARLRRKDIPGFPKFFVGLKPLVDETGKARKWARELAEAYVERTRLEYQIALRQKLELLIVPDLVELAEHYAKTSRVVIFVNFKKTIAALQDALSKVFGMTIPAIDGDTTGAKREAIRKSFQANAIPALPVNVQAGGVGIGLHDPTGEVDRTDLISPCYSVRLLEQVFGRTTRDGGGFSSKYLVYFADTLQAVVASTVLEKRDHLAALNDAVLHGVVNDPNTYTDTTTPRDPQPGDLDHRPGKRLRTKKSEAPGDHQSVTARRSQSGRPLERKLRVQRGPAKVDPENARQDRPATEPGHAQNCDQLD